MTELQTNLARLRQLVEARTVECPRLLRPLFLHGHGCDLCQGTGQVPDPAFAGLLEELRATDEATQAVLETMEKLGTKREETTCPKL